MTVPLLIRSSLVYREPSCGCRSPGSNGKRAGLFCPLGGVTWALLSRSKHAARQGGRCFGLFLFELQRLPLPSQEKQDNVLVLP